MGGGCGRGAPERGNGSVRGSQCMGRAETISAWEHQLHGDTSLPCPGANAICPPWALLQVTAATRYSLRKAEVKSARVGQEASKAREHHPQLLLTLHCHFLAVMQ